MTRMRIAVLSCVIAAGVCASSSAQDQTRGIYAVSKAGEKIPLYNDYRALVIGVSDYNNGWPDLPNAVKDAREVAEKLRKLGFTVSLIENPTSKELRDALNKFIYEDGKEPDRALFLFFAGHGDTEELADGTRLGYIIPTDCPLLRDDQRGFGDKAVGMNYIETLSLKVKSRHLLAAFDSCFSGSLFNLTREAPTDITEKCSQPVRQYITAGREDETVPDRSVFKQCMLDALDGEADLNKDNYVTGSELGMYLDAKVVNYSKGGQHPQYGKINNPKLDKGDFVFVLPGSTGVSPVKPVDMTGWDKDKAEIARRQEEAKRKAEEEASRQAAETRRKAKEELEANARRAYDIAKQIDGAEGYSAAERAAKWNKYLADFGSVGYQTDFARQRAEHWKNYRPPVVAPGAGGTPALPGGKAMTLDLGGGAQMRFALIPAGSFAMGEGGNTHTVRLTKPFYMGVTEVTNGQYQQFLKDSGYDGSGDADGDYLKHFKGGSDMPKEAEYPIVWVSWKNAVKFCEWMSGKAGKTVRLPTEAEWEYACRAGSSTAYCFGDSDSGLGEYAWYSVNAGGKTHPVGQRKPNAWGLYDMHGNVWEWCQDWYGEYPSGAASDPQGPSSGTSRVLRGGSWYCDANGTRSALRGSYFPSNSGSYCGFRVVAVPRQ
ncbi:MAG TPA: SUMF1/EgtB/PvdO family nonheme iron enzyme [Candidatus Brocadiia bacterium]|nr:SUMF1/EgtB/PvdO family nonheme iron enzyme [Candidatus Brocadiia bacterium]